MGDLDGRVAIVTGAGRGLGRVEALELARQGASVIVNDLGTEADGSGKSTDPAESVVAEIQALGGRAVSHFGDVGDWNDTEALVKRAIDEFGDLNIVVNNAGFCRDGMLFKMTEPQFDSVVRVHLKGHFLTMRHTLAYWRDRFKAGGGEKPIYGRLISTASDAFLIGNLGQANYAAAKAGLAFMTLSAAREILRFGATANVICPRARTRMNEAGPWAAIFEKPAEGFDTFAPENVSPLVAWLASPNAARVSGQIFTVSGRNVSVLERPRIAAAFENPRAWCVEDLQKQLGAHFEKLEPVEDGFAMPMA
ncbi:MAG: SDR family NAD(P)-dependent oxidoreductase [Deltaproteobacteria bacterium]|nr:MAG: SDR family NAD(P)-dependent oxidoreductase [Deltaproteobacteria bacterium]